MIKETPHPNWLNEILHSLKPLEDKVVFHPLFEEFGRGRLSVRHLQKILINFYPLVEAFPQYMALNLAKVPSANSHYSVARSWLIRNINQERLHSDWWRNLAGGFGVPPESLDREISSPPELDAINNYLWRVCTHGSLAEGMAASNYAIEGPTGAWTKNVREGFKHYEKKRNVTINKKTLAWVYAHARYDDRHPIEALEIIKLATATKDEQKRVRAAALRTLQYYNLALDAALSLVDRNNESESS